MHFHYISPSTLPSRTANSVHVVWQCEALAQCGVDVTLYAKRAMFNEEDLPQALDNAYGVKSTAFRLKTIYSPSSIGNSLKIAHHAVRCIRQERRGGMILSRNLYAAFVLARIYKMPIVFETHQLETGLRKWMQRMIVRCPWVITVLISNHLAAYIEKHLGVAPSRPLVLHDAAPEGIDPIFDEITRRQQLGMLVDVASGSWRKVCGYFGHLYSGRGVEIVEAMALARPNVLFLIYGGTDTDLEYRRSKSRIPNLFFMGHITHPRARQLMCLMDVLLMPYQESVSIGLAGHDTARWMSPMKMFEYLGAGVPIISSDLPVLREVLRHEKNCLLVQPADTGAWTAALDKLEKEPNMAARIGATAHEEYKSQHTWRRRAEQILQAARQL